MVMLMLMQVLLPSEAEKEGVGTGTRVSRERWEARPGPALPHLLLARAGRGLGAVSSPVGLETGHCGELVPVVSSRDRLRPW